MVFKNFFRSCAMVESSLSIGRVNSYWFSICMPISQTNIQWSPEHGFINILTHSCFKGGLRPDTEWFNPYAAGG